MSRLAALCALVFTLVVASAQLATAQTCRALPAIGENSKGNIGGQLAFAYQQFGFDAGLTYGTSHAFGGFWYGKNNYTQFAYTSTIVGFNLGGQFAIGKDRPVSICPMFVFSDDSASDLNAAALSETIDTRAGGASIGFVLWSGHQREIVPTVDLFAGQLRDSLAIPGENVTERSTIGIVTLGVSLVFDHRISLRPAYSRQIGGAHPTDAVQFAGKAHGSFTVTAVFAYGHR